MFEHELGFIVVMGAIAVGIPIIVICFFEYREYKSQRFRAARFKDLRKKVKQKQCVHNMVRLDQTIQSQEYDGRYWRTVSFIPMVCAKNCGHTERMWL